MLIPYRSVKLFFSRNSKVKPTGWIGANYGFDNELRLNRSLQPDEINITPRIISMIYNICITVIK